MTTFDHITEPSTPDAISGRPEGDDSPLGDPACDHDPGTPVIVVHPGRLSGTPTINHSRIPAIIVAETYWAHGVDEVKAMWDHLSEADILVRCWYVARFRVSRRLRTAWAEWLPVADQMLWSKETIDQCPWPPWAEDERFTDAQG